MKLKIDKILIILLILYFSIRIIILFLSPYLFYWEEEHRGTLANEINKGMITNFFYYEWNTYQGGFLIISALIAFFFRIFGPSQYALKLPALLISPLGLVFGYEFCKKFLNKKIAVVYALLFIFSPIYFTGRTLISEGSFLETSVFTLIVIYLFNLYLLNKKKKYIIILGLISGFAFFFEYTSLIGVILCIFLWFCVEKKILFKKDFYIFIIFLLIGLLPFFHRELSNQYKGFDKLIEASFQSEKNIIQIITDRFYNFLSFGFLDSLYFPNIFSIPGMYFSIFYYLTFLTSIGFVIFICRKRLYKIFSDIFVFKNTDRKFVMGEVSVILYVFLFILIYSLVSFSDTNVPRPYNFEAYFIHRYSIPLYPFVFLSISIMIGKFLDTKYKEQTLYLIAFLLLFCVISNLAMTGKIPKVEINGENHTNITSFSYSGYELKAMFGWGGNWDMDDENILRTEEQYKSCNNENCYLATTWSSTWAYGLDPLSLFKKCRETNNNSCFNDMSFIWGYRVPSFDTLSGISICNKFNEKYIGNCYESVGFVNGLKFDNFSMAESEFLKTQEEYSNSIKSSSEFVCTNFLPFKLLNKLKFIFPICNKILSFSALNYPFKPNMMNYYDDYKCGVAKGLGWKNETFCQTVNFSFKDCCYNLDEIKRIIVEYNPQRLCKKMNNYTDVCDITWENLFLRIN